MRNKKLAAGLGGVTAVAAAVALTAGTFAAFSDTEQRGVIATGGTMDLQVSNTHGDIFGENGYFTVSGTVAPGDTIGSTTFTLKNAGDVAGNLSFDFETVTNDENTLTDPEEDAGDNSADEGELPENLQLVVDGPGGQDVTTSLDQLAEWGSFNNGGTLAADETAEYKLTLSVPQDATSEFQTDKAKFQITANLDQQVQN
ncbi:camelysin-like metallo-endopeptidase [Halopolyspora algeriensis]|uniref:Camelysin-like metallo-endopeptidase n=1 Tax=Halopolyspora algeriensis TaxID=1500506 RepID=A0A368VVE9_9ACTN|nr:TasA family protein [Halopolyspora algeriensis]RCW45266.1 camelysin-like metallo-endopeptidase [Halopolyspora algeriensis]TQM53015.1 camelysin-like metallo-endopeptidase [Halopolyspora algeriensis]